MSLEFMGRKLGMTQIFTDVGERIPVTVVRAGPCTVIQKKTPGRDGYSAVQLGFEERRERHTTGAMKGHFAAADTAPRRVVYEVRVPEDEVVALEPGQELRCDVAFQEGQDVSVTGRSKGRGFTGVIKRWGFKTSKATHGTHESFRHGGAISAGTYPGRVLKGKKMAGQHGSRQVTIRGLVVARMDADRNLLFIRGAVPGHRNGLVRVRPDPSG